MSLATAAILDAIKQGEITKVDTLLQEMEKKEKIDLNFAEKALCLALHEDSEKLGEKGIREKLIVVLLKFTSFQEVAVWPDPKEKESFYTFQSLGEPQSSFEINATKANGFLRYALKYSPVGITEQFLQVPSVLKALFEDKQYSLLWEKLDELGKYPPDRDVNLVRLLLKAYGEDRFSTLKKFFSDKGAAQATEWLVHLSRNTAGEAAKPEGPTSEQSTPLQDEAFRSDSQPSSSLPTEPTDSKERRERSLSSGNTEESAGSHVIRRTDTSCSRFHQAMKAHDLSNLSEATPNASFTPGYQQASSQRKRKGPTPDQATSATSAGKSTVTEDQEASTEEPGKRSRAGN